jgi:hypothetical protein
MDGARCVPAVITDWYSLFTFGPISGVEPEVIIFYLLYVPYPRVYLSGEYPTKKSTLNAVQTRAQQALFFSHPGYCGFVNHDISFFFNSFLLFQTTYIKESNQGGYFIYQVGTVTT